MNPLTKTYVSLGLVFLALFEFWAAMRIFGRRKPLPHAKLVLRLHRIGGYVFLVYFAWISWICVNMMGRLAEGWNAFDNVSNATGWHLDARGFYHGFLAITIFVLLLLKISFVRFYRRYVKYVPLLGIIITVGMLVLWAIAGWMFLILLGTTRVETLPTAATILPW